MVWSFIYHAKCECRFRIFQLIFVLIIIILCISTTDSRQQNKLYSFEGKWKSDEKIDYIQMDPNESIIFGCAFKSKVTAGDMQKNENRFYGHVTVLMNTFSYKCYPLLYIYSVTNWMFCILQIWPNFHANDEWQIWYNILNKLYLRVNSNYKFKVKQHCVWLVQQ